MIFQDCALHFHRISLKSSSFLGEKLGYGGSYYCCQEGQEKMSRKKFVLRWHGPKMKINLTPETVLEKGFEFWVAWRFHFLWIFTTTSSALENSVALKKIPTTAAAAIFGGGSIRCCCYPNIQYRMVFQCIGNNRKKAAVLENHPKSLILFTKLRAKRRYSNFCAILCLLWFAKVCPHSTPKLAPFCKQNNTKMRLFVANFKHCEYSHGSSLKRLASLLLLLRSAERTLESISLCKLSW